MLFVVEVNGKKRGEKLPAKTKKLRYGHFIAKINKKWKEYQNGYTFLMKNDYQLNKSYAGTGWVYHITFSARWIVKKKTKKKGKVSWAKSVRSSSFIFRLHNLTHKLRDILKAVKSSCLITLRSFDFWTWPYGSAVVNEWELLFIFPFRTSERERRVIMPWLVCRGSPLSCDQPSVVERHKKTLEFVARKARGPLRHKVLCNAVWKLRSKQDCTSLMFRKDLLLREW